jgi:hypothetical protein
MTPMLTRLEQELAVCHDPIRQAELHAERAAYLARTGHFGEAAEVLSWLRKSYGDGRSARVSVWIMFVEGLVLYFERLSADARDRLLRANAISSAAGLSDLHLLTAAWLAHLEFEHGNFEEMGRLLSILVSYPDRISPSIKSRMAIVLADAFAYSGDRKKSQLWFEICRQNALDAGDRATVGALMYNRAVFGLWRLRIDHFAYGHPVDLNHLGLLEMELDSSWAFQKGTDVVSLNHLVVLSRARMLVFRNKFAEAIDVLQELRDRIPLLENRVNRSSVLSDLCWCLYKSEDSDAALDIARNIDFIEVRHLDVDDRFVAFSILAQVADGLGDSTLQLMFQSEIVAAHQAYIAEMTRLQSILHSDSLAPNERPK